VELEVIEQLKHTNVRFMGSLVELRLMHRDYEPRGWERWRLAGALLP
jgi:hypothetical protein